MFFHNFKYTFKALIHDKTMLFWTFAFPIVLGTFFYMAFSNIENGEKLAAFKIAVVNDHSFQQEELLVQSLAQMDIAQNKDGVFSIHYTTLEEAKKMLEEKTITGYFQMDQEKPLVVVKESGVEETVFKYAIDQILEAEKMIGDVVSAEVESSLGSGQEIDVSQITQQALQLYQNSSGKLVDESSDHLSYTVVEFYTLIAMCALYGAIFGVIVINQSTPNLSTKGARVSVAPIKRGTLLGSGLLAGYVVQLFGLFLLLGFLLFILQIDFGSKVFPIFLLSIIGSLAGLSLGMFVGSCFKTNENNKVGIIISITMFCCFLSGMMGITMKFIVDKNLPWLNLINPANMITDGFYSLYYYPTMDRYYFNIFSLLLFSALLFIISILTLRRKKYDSI